MSGQTAESGLPPGASGLYDPETERAACGVGMVVAIDGQPQRRVVELGILALKAVWHRGAVDADGRTGDGAGIHIQIPQAPFIRHLRENGVSVDSGSVAAGMIFLPRTDIAAQEQCRVIVEGEILAFGHRIRGWRQVPVDVSVLGDKAAASRPEIEQILVEKKDGTDPAVFESQLYIIRRLIEKRVAAAQIMNFYICSLSSRTIIYKGLFLAEQIDNFYPDLKNPDIVSNFAIFHQRYSTNTFPAWHLSQPFRVLAHNGEINTIRGNVNWMRSHEVRMEARAFGFSVDGNEVNFSHAIRPVIDRGSSDSAALDAVFEVMVRAGRTAPLVKSMLMPGAASADEGLSPALRAFYTYAYAVMEPWDGPAAICACDGSWLLAGMDRNGLRPLRFSLTGDGLLVVGSETGMIPDIREDGIVRKGRIGPGEMLAVNLDEGRLYGFDGLREHLANEFPYQNWIGHIHDLREVLPALGPAAPRLSPGDLVRAQIAAGRTREELEMILDTMGREGREPVGSMGDDTPLAVFSRQWRGIQCCFRQQFSQVTNPPIDSLRERRVMSLDTRLGNLGNILDASPAQMQLMQLDSPVLTTAGHLALRRHIREHTGEQEGVIDCTFPVDSPEGTLRSTLGRLREEAESLAQAGARHLVLTDEALSPGRIAVPSILAAGAVHSHLVARGLRPFVSLHLRSADCLDVHYHAVLVGVGATTVNAWLAEESLYRRHAAGLFGEQPLAAVIAGYKKAVDDGLLKVISKMGISIISSYRGGYNFEAVGLSRSLAADLFPGMPSRISGIGLSGLEKGIRRQHALGFAAPEPVMAPGGVHVLRRRGEYHAWNGTAIRLLQRAVDSNSHSVFREFSALQHRGEGEGVVPALRALLDFRPDHPPPVPAAEVEDVSLIRRRFVTPGMSLGALSPEAHEALNIAMNRMGAKSNSGEGGEDPASSRLRPNGDNPSAAIRQVASGRFGVTTTYLAGCREIEIKIAQGAKPGEGGHLPGPKVNSMIARLRHSAPGVTLISPPPHHDIYSIEDLAQLIYDLKQVNPVARVCVKLVARHGIGTIAAGVAKAHADVILIAGHSGGTGAAPVTSISYAGIPWEMGLAEVNQVLSLNGLRHRVVLRTDGGIRTGRDVVIAAMLGAEEYGIGTAALVAMGCLMVRQCHSNTCPVGICTQRQELREKFAGTPERVIRMFSFVAEEVRDLLAGLGFRSLDDVIGRTDLLRQVSSGNPDLDSLDLNPLLSSANAGGKPGRCTITGRNEVTPALDARIIRDAAHFFRTGERLHLNYNIRNTDRSVGARFSSEMLRSFPDRVFHDDHVQITLRGSAGQSAGAFAIRGMTLEIIGDANDYVAKGLSGGQVIVRPSPSSPLVWRDSVIVGNTVLYGATGGFLFAAGQAGERFAVRNSGAMAVVEGCGTNGCEYMTGGVAVILGGVGYNFGAGMTGGRAFIYDGSGQVPSMLNGDVCCGGLADESEPELQELLTRHAERTGSPLAREILDDWSGARELFLEVVPAGQQASVRMRRAGHAA